MRSSERFRATLLEHLLALIAMSLVLFYAYVQFFQMPYIGFDITRGVVDEVKVPGELQVGDELIQFGDVTMAEFNADWRVQLLGNLQPGDVIPLVVRRAGLIHEIQWVVPGITRSEFISRLGNQWWLAIVFGLLGLLTLLLVRPRDGRWRLLVAFSFLTALWLSASVVSRWHLWASAGVLSSAMWFCLPVYIQLHWDFPQPLRPVSPWVWRGFYAVTLALALAYLASLIPITWASLAVALGALGALLLLLSRYVFRPAQQRETGLLLAGGLLTFLPSILLGAIDGLLSVTSTGIRFSLLGLIALPLFYFYVAYRRQLGNFELRANRLLGAYLFFLGLGLLVSMILSIKEAATGVVGIDATTSLLMTLAVAIISATSLRPFQRLVDSRLLGISIPSESVAEIFTNRLATSLNNQAIVALLTGEVLPSLLIRQSVLFRLAQGKLALVYVAGIEEGRLPDSEEVRDWVIEPEHYPVSDPASNHLGWVQLALPVAIEGRVIGLWLFGRRDPDDFYSQDIIKTLRLLANQLAIALTNITQAEQLLILNQIHIEQYESERMHVARELHDEVLNELSPLANSSQPAASLSPERAAMVAVKIRDVISGLRPLSLHYGLYYGLQALFDELEARHGPACKLQFEVTGESIRYDPAIELHIYRITQQACDNSLKHGQPHRLGLRGTLLAEQISLVVEDDGRGFLATGNLDLAYLLTNKHFGIAGMLERASIIGASLTINSAPRAGTRIELRWPAIRQ